MIYLTALIISSLLSTPNKGLDDHHYIQTSQMVIDSFFQMYETIDKPKSKVVFTNERNGERFVSYKEYLIKRFKPERKTYRIRRFESLNENESKFLKYLANKHNPENSPKEFYYKLVNYWLLPHFLTHLFNIPDISEKDKSDAEYTIQIEIAVDKRTFIFMTESGFINEFKDFYGMMNTIHNGIDLPGIKNLNDIFEVEVDVENSFKDLYTKSGTMLKAIDSFIHREASVPEYK